MRKTFTALWSLLLLMTVVANASAQQSIDWVTDVNQAREMAKQQNRPILLHFYADWCVPCRKLDREVFPNNAVIQVISSNFIPVKVDIDKLKPLAQHFQVSTIPADVIVTAEGKVLYQQQSSMDANVLVTALDGVAKRFGPANRAVAATNPNINRANVAVTQPRQGQPPTRNIGPQGDLNRGGSFQPSNADDDPQMQINPHVASNRQPLNAPYAGPQSPAPIEPRTHAPNLHPNNGTVQQPGLTLPPRVGPNNGIVGPTQQLPSHQNHLVQQPTNPVAYAPAPSNKQIAMDGFCPVTMIEKSKWVEANPQYGVVHRKRTYLFAGPEQQKKFLQDPDRFSPALSRVRSSEVC